MFAYHWNQIFIYYINLISLAVTHRKTPSGIVSVEGGTTGIAAAADYNGAGFSWSGRDEDARAEAPEVLRIDPKFSLEEFEKKAGKRLVNVLRKAGLK